MQKKVIVWGFDSRVVRNSIAKLEADQVIDLKRWFVVDKYSKDEFFLNRENCVFISKEWRTGNIRNITNYPDEVISSVVFEHSTFFLQHMARDTEFYRLPVYEYTNVANMLVNYFYNVIIKDGIEVVLFHDVPHGGNCASCYILYCVAKAMGRKTLFLLPSLLETDRFGYCYNVEDVGVYSEVPEYIGQNVSITHIEKKFEKDLAYMKPEVIKNELGINKDRYLRFIKNPQKWIDDRKEVISENACKYSDIWDFIARKSVYTLSEYFYKRLYKNNSLKYVADEVDLEKKFVYFPLHLQPEMTTDTLGGMYFDQVLAIEKVRRLIPDDWMIYVKENPKQKNYMRGKYFFERIVCIPNCKFVSRKYDTYELLKKSQFVATITGTAGWEAVSGGKCALIFGNAWYAAFDGVFKYSDDLTYQEITSYKIDHEKLEEQYNMLKRKTAQGITCDDTLAYIDYEVDYQKNEKAMYDFLVFIMKHL